MRTLLADSSGRFWAMAADGLMMSADKGENWRSWSNDAGLVQKQLRCILETTDGGIVVVSDRDDNNVTRFDGDQWLTDEQSQLGINVTTAAQTPDQTIWVAAQIVFTCSGTTNGQVTTLVM